MTETISPRTTDITLSRTTPTAADLAAERLHARRAALKSRHAQGLTRLMEQRSDLRGVHALADLVDDAVRWTA